MLVLLVAAIATTDVVTSSSLRSFLYGRLDEQVDVAQSQAYLYLETNYHRSVQAGDLAATDPQAWLSQLAAPVSASPLGLGAATAGDSPDLGVPASTPLSGNGTPTATSPAAAGRFGRLLASVLSSRISPDVYAEVLGVDGRVLFQRPSGSSGYRDPAPVLPRVLPVRAVPALHRFGTGHGVYLPDQPSFTARAQGARGPYYRGEALAVPGGTLVNVIALAPTEQTLSSLTHVELLVSVVVVIALLLLGLWIVRL
ncbi:MAG: hypothetical protein ACYDB3_12210, partial [Acidimicrobiales bacterium]